MSYPYLNDLIMDLTGWQLPLRLPMFGLMVSLSLLVGAMLFIAQLKSLQADGHLPRDKNFPLYTIVSELGLIAVLVGIAGSKIFHILEYPQHFLKDPLGALTAEGGLTIYGGLVTGLAAGALYVRRKKLPLLRICDAVAPGMMLAYGIGRLGCQLSGDGDWGIPANLALKPSWWPMSLWAQTYKNNILEITIPEPGVYPTPLYESFMAAVLFAVLWRLRRHPYQAGWLFALYLVFCGVERLLIEQIRVNTKFNLPAISVTQAEVISVIFIILGVIGLATLHRRSVRP